MARASKCPADATEFDIYNPARSQFDGVFRVRQTSDCSSSKAVLKSNLTA
ncbi:MAG: hypothetical protein ACR2GD_01715 [Pyrinomonadaceae bacterium]